VAERGAMYDASGVFYWEKMVVGPEAADMVDLRLPVKQDLLLLSKALDRKISQLNVCVLERPRHEGLVREMGEVGGRVNFMRDGGVAGGIAAARHNTDVDILLGTGGTPEGIITACAIKATGGMIQGRLTPVDEAERQKALDAGHDLD